MKLSRYSIYLAILLFAAASFGQTRFRSGIFLHHSTGGCIWGPNGGQVSVPAEIAKYNLSHTLVGADSVKMIETWWPSGDNEWTTWHTIFDNGDASNDIRPFFSSYPVIMIKSCFPSADMSGVGSNADTLSPTIKSVANYKWHWRSLISVMKRRPQNFFVIWTNAPQVAGSTNASEAALSNAFCRWAKDTLAAGLDPVVGAFPKNVFVFDFFHILAGADGMLPLQLASSSTDSHPNSTATTLAAPELVKRVFDAALAYESPTEVVETNATIPETPLLYQNYPNPFNPSTTLGFRVPGTGNRHEAISHRWVRLGVYDLLGREVAVLVNEKKASGEYSVMFDGRGLGSGVYFYRLQVRPLDASAGLDSPSGAGSYTETKRLLLMR